MSKFYRVRWEIDIEADTPEKAAQEALEIQTAVDRSIELSGTFEVRDEAKGVVTVVDLGAMLAD